MDVSHFGLFDLVHNQARWTAQPMVALEDRVVPIESVRHGVANDNVKRPAVRLGRADPPLRGRPYKSLFRLMLHRRTEPGQA
jgi:hypothetical protein